jgi:hypothetical protein
VDPFTGSNETWQVETEAAPVAVDGSAPVGRIGDRCLPPGFPPQNGEILNPQPLPPSSAPIALKPDGMLASATCSPGMSFREFRFEPRCLHCRVVPLTPLCFAGFEEWEAIKTIHLGNPHRFEQTGCMECASRRSYQRWGDHCICLLYLYVETIPTSAQYGTPLCPILLIATFEETPAWDL